MTIQEYIDSIPIDRRLAFDCMRQICKRTLEPLGFEECINYKMLGYVVPLTIYPKGYHCDPTLPLPFVSLANQKNSINLYHLGIYSNTSLLQWWTNQWKLHSLHKLDMGKSCIRFKNTDHIPYDLIEELLCKVSSKQWIYHYESHITMSK